MNKMKRITVLFISFILLFSLAFGFVVTLTNKTNAMAATDTLSDPTVKDDEITSYDEKYVDDYRAKLEKENNNENKDNNNNENNENDDVNNSQSRLAIDTPYDGKWRELTVKNLKAMTTNYWPAKELGTYYFYLKEDTVLNIEAKDVPLFHNMLIVLNGYALSGNINFISGVRAGNQVVKLSIYDKFARVTFNSRAQPAVPIESIAKYNSKPDKYYSYDSKTGGYTDYSTTQPAKAEDVTNLPTYKEGTYIHVKGGAISPIKDKDGNRIDCNLEIKAHGYLKLSNLINYNAYIDLWGVNIVGVNVSNENKPDYILEGAVNKNAGSITLKGCTIIANASKQGALHISVPTSYSYTKLFGTKIYSNRVDDPSIGAKSSNSNISGYFCDIKGSTISGGTEMFYEASSVGVVSQPLSEGKPMVFSLRGVQLPHGNYNNPYNEMLYNDPFNIFPKIEKSDRSGRWISLSKFTKWQSERGIGDIAEIIGTIELIANVEFDYWAKSPQLSFIVHGSSAGGVGGGNTLKIMNAKKNESDSHFTVAEVGRISTANTNIDKKTKESETKITIDGSVTVIAGRAEYTIPVGSAVNVGYNQTLKEGVNYSNYGVYSIINKGTVTVEGNPDDKVNINYAVIDNIKNYGTLNVNKNAKVNTLHNKLSVKITENAEIATLTSTHQGDKFAAPQITISKTPRIIDFALDNNAKTIVQVQADATPKFGKETDTPLKEEFTIPVGTYFEVGENARIMQTINNNGQVSIKAGGQVNAIYGQGSLIIQSKLLNGTLVAGQATIPNGKSYDGLIYNQGKLTVNGKATDVTGSRLYTKESDANAKDESSLTISTTGIVTVKAGSTTYDNLYRVLMKMSDATKSEKRDYSGYITNNGTLNVLGTATIVEGTGTVYIESEATAKFVKGGPIGTGIGASEKAYTGAVINNGGTIISEIKIDNIQGGTGTITVGSGSLLTVAKGHRFEGKITVNKPEKENLDSIFNYGLIVEGYVDEIAGVGDVMILSSGEVRWTRDSKFTGKIQNAGRFSIDATMSIDEVGSFSNHVVRNSSMLGYGTLRVNEGATFSLPSKKMLDGHIDNQGTFSLYGSIDNVKSIKNTGRFQIEKTSTMTLASSQTMDGVVVNDGVFRVQGKVNNLIGSGALNIENKALVTVANGNTYTGLVRNFGTINAEGTVRNLTGDGVVNVQVGGNIQIGSANRMATVNNNGGVAEINGTVDTLKAIAGETIVNGSLQSLQVENTGKVNLADKSTVTENIDILSNGVLDIPVGFTTEALITNNATVNIAGKVNEVKNNGVANIASTNAVVNRIMNNATLNIVLGNSSARNAEQSVIGIENLGLLNIARDVTYTIGADKHLTGSINNAGVLNIEGIVDDLIGAGTTNVLEGATVTVVAGKELTGKINNAGTLYNRGKIGTLENSGIANIASEVSVLRFVSGEIVVTSSNARMPGVVTVPRDGKMTINSGITLASVVMNDGELNINGTVPSVINGTFGVLLVNVDAKVTKITTEGEVVINAAATVNEMIVNAGDVEVKDLARIKNTTFNGGTLVIRERANVAKINNMSTFGTLLDYREEVKISMNIGAVTLLVILAVAILTIIFVVGMPRRKKDLTNAATKAYNNMGVSLSKSTKYTSKRKIFNKAS